MLSHTNHYIDKLPRLIGSPFTSGGTLQGISKGMSRGLVARVFAQTKCVGQHTSIIYQNKLPYHTVIVSSLLLVLQLFEPLLSYNHIMIHNTHVAPRRMSCDAFPASPGSAARPQLRWPGCISFISARATHDARCCSMGFY